MFTKTVGRFIAPMLIFLPFLLHCGSVKASEYAFTGTVNFVESSRFPTLTPQIEEGEHFSGVLNYDPSKLVGPVGDPSAAVSPDGRLTVKFEDSQVVMETNPSAGLYFFNTGGTGDNWRVRDNYDLGAEPMFVYQPPSIQLAADPILWYHEIALSGDPTTLLTGSGQLGVFNNADGLQIGGVITNLALIPEPETYALLLSGLALISLIARRRRLSAETR